MKPTAKRVPPQTSLILLFLLAGGAPRLTADDFGKPASSPELTRFCQPVVGQPFNQNVTCDPRWYQGESTIAADVIRKILVGAQNDLYAALGGCNPAAKLGTFGDCGVSVAVNFRPIPLGLPWSRYKLTRTWGDPAKNYQQYTFRTGYDPSVAVDSRGRYYVVYGVSDLDLTGLSPGAIEKGYDPDERNDHLEVPNAVVVARSDNVGFLWLKTNAVAYDPTGAKHWDDKPWIAIDTKSTKYRDRVYVAWTRNWTRDKLGRGQDIVLAFSPNLGETWVGPNIGPAIVNTGNATSRRVIGAFPAVAPNGTVYVAWDDYGNQTLYINKSMDGGVTWESPVAIARTDSDEPGGLGIDIGCNSGRTMTAIPAMAIDNAGNIFVVYASRPLVIAGGLGARRGGAPGLRLPCLDHHVK